MRAHRWKLSSGEVELHGFERLGADAGVALVHGVDSPLAAIAAQ